MDLANPAVQNNVDRLFGNGEWREQPFMKLSRIAREDAFFELLHFEVEGQTLFSAFVLALIQKTG